MFTHNSKLYTLIPQCLYYSHVVELYVDELAAIPEKF